MEAIGASIESGENDDELNSCDRSYFKAGQEGEDIEGHLFAFVKNNKEAIAL